MCIDPPITTNISITTSRLTFSAIDTITIRKPSRNAYRFVCQSAQEIGGNKSQSEILVIYFQLRKDTS